jgi:L-ascorbate metabolism protein UlaG (beta-lactamase superfamily)
MLITDGHFDHVHDAVPLPQKFSRQVVAIYEMCHWLESKGVKNIVCDEQGRVAEGRAGDGDHDGRGAPLRDSGRRQEYLWRRGGGYVLRFEDGRAVFAGDTNVLQTCNLLSSCITPSSRFCPSAICSR